MTSVVPSTCCGRPGEGCACAAEATCSCGKKPALACDCEHNVVENEIMGAKCSCNKRPQGRCNCERAVKENAAVTGGTCACGKRAEGCCNCDGTEVAAYSGETDFTNK